MVEVLVVKGDVGRLNTVFKFGLHSWMLFALSVAAILPWMWRRATQFGRPVTLALCGTVVVVLLTGLVYPLTATPARLADRWAPDAPRTLDGNAYMALVNAERNGQPFSLNQDAAAITWLQNNTDGTPILLEAHLPSYQWAGRVAVNTGMPTLLGWEWHQIQQRNAVNATPVINHRQQVISRIFNTGDPIEALEQLRAYGVEYVYVGGIERATYDPNGLLKFELMAERGYLEPVFSQGQTTIYRVVEPGRPTQLTNDLPIVPPTADTIPALMLDVPVNELPAVNEYAWLGEAGQNSWIAMLLWLVAIYGIGLLGLPVAYAVFGTWRDGGAIFAKPIGFLLLGYAVWLPTSLGLQQYDLWGVLSGVLLLLIGHAALLWWIGRPTTGGQAVQQGLAAGLRMLVNDLRQRRRAVLAGEAVFLLAFAALTVIRAFNPDLWHPTWGGEKPMEFGFLNAILRSPVMPPYDPFFSGGYINYYYYGFYLFSLPIKLTGIAAAIGFNLAVATIFGLFLAGLYGLAKQITGRARYGVLAALLVGVAGNLSAVFTTAWGWSSGIGGVMQALSGGLAGFGERLGTWYIGPSRVIEYTINEFPFFTFIFADLHPHMIVLPFSVLAIALAYRVLHDVGHIRRVVPLLALTLGGLAVTNSWDFPTFALLSGLAFVGAGWRGAGGSFRRAILFGLLATATAFSGLVLYAPFFDHYYAMVGGVDNVPLATGTPLSDYLVVFGPALAIVLPLILGALWRIWRGSPRRQLLDRPAWSWPFPILPVAALVAAIVLPNLGLRIVLAALLLGLIPVLARREIRTTIWYSLTLAWVGLAVSLGFELLYIRDHLAGGDWFRMNTVFKFGMHAWVLFGLAAAIGLPTLLIGLRRAAGLPGQALGLAFLAVVAVLASIYPLAGVPSRIGNRFAVETGPTLDGLAFMRQARFTYDCENSGGCGPGIERPTVDLSGDAAAIEWLNRSIEGTPIVVQSNLWFYRSYGIRIAANTGLPTVISSLHANEQRDPAITAARDRDVEVFYGSADIEDALRFLATYRVNYVYVGGVEHALYAPEALAKFAQMRGTYLNPVYDTPEVQIYQCSAFPQRTPALNHTILQPTQRRRHRRNCPPAKSPPVWSSWKKKCRPIPATDRWPSG